MQNSQINQKQEAALLTVGYQLYKQGRFNEAASIFEGLSVLVKNNSYVRGILGALYQRQGKYEAAVNRYTEALILFPKDIHSITNRGETYLRLGQFQNASSDLSKAIELDPEKIHPAANRARLLVCLVQDAIQLAKEKGTQALEQENRKTRKVS